MMRQLAAKVLYGTVLILRNHIRGGEEVCKMITLVIFSYGGNRKTDYKEGGKGSGKGQNLIT